MFIKLLTCFTLLALPPLIFISLTSSSAAALDYSSTMLKIAAADDTLSGEKIKPAECGSLSLTDNFITGSGTFSDNTGSNTLLIGSASADTIGGLGGNDCLVAVDGPDALDGGSGSDVCLGGAGDDEFSNCESCYGGSGSDTDLTATCTISSSIEAP